MNSEFYKTFKFSIFCTVFGYIAQFYIIIFVTFVFSANLQKSIHMVL